MNIRNVLIPPPGQHQCRHLGLHGSPPLIREQVQTLRGPGERKVFCMYVCMYVLGRDACMYICIYGFCLFAFVIFLCVLMYVCMYVYMYE